MAAVAHQRATARVHELALMRIVDYMPVSRGSKTDRLGIRPFRAGASVHVSGGRCALAEPATVGELMRGMPFSGG